MESEISSKLLDNVDFIANVYKIIKTAGLQASQNPSVVANRNKTCVIKIGEEGVDRRSACEVSDKYTVDFDANDIMVVGGAALNLYDYKLKGFKERHKFDALEKYIKKSTSDIDIVWWPRSSATDVITTSKSEAITELVKLFKQKLVENFRIKTNRDILKDQIKKAIPDIKGVEALSITIEPLPDYREHIEVAGIWTIQLNFTIGSYPKLKLCDIVIHDNGSSQRWDPDGKPINKLLPAEWDPIYCVPKPGYFNSINYLDINGIDIAVPAIVSFVNQQMLAFDNLIRMGNNKGLINYKRVEFIKKLLENFDMDDASNKINYKDVFHTEDNEMRLQSITELIHRVEDSLKKNNMKILEICSTLNVKNDKIVEALCLDAKLEPQRAELEAYRLSEMGRLDEIQQQIKIHMLERVPAKFQPMYLSIIKKIDNVIDSIDHMTLIQLKGHKEKKHANTTTKFINAALKEANLEVSEEFKKRGVLSTTPSNIASLGSFPPGTEIVQSYGYPRKQYPPPRDPHITYTDPNSGRAIKWRKEIGWYFPDPPPPPRGPPPRVMPAMAPSMAQPISMIPMYTMGEPPYYSMAPPPQPPPPHFMPVYQAHPSIVGYPSTSVPVGVTATPRLPLKKRGGNNKSTRKNKK